MSHQDHGTLRAIEYEKAIYLVPEEHADHVLKRCLDHQSVPFNETPLHFSSSMVIDAEGRAIKARWTKTACLTEDRRRTREQIEERIACLKAPVPGGCHPDVEVEWKALEWVLSEDQDPTFEELNASHDYTTWLRVVRAEQKRRQRDAKKGANG